MSHNILNVYVCENGVSKPLLEVLSDLIKRNVDIRLIHAKEPGAGVGMKGVHKRNFEAGILTDDPVLVENAMEQFDSVFRGDHSGYCKCNYLKII